MTSKTWTLCAFLFWGGLVSSQTESGNINQHREIEIGTIRDLHVSLIKKNELSGVNTQKNLRISYLPKKAKASDMFTDMSDTLELAAFIKSLKELNLNIDSVS